jgi:bifunctional ADP-heptose synthase (sugar kinase/adenylyltransferase)
MGSMKTLGELLIKVAGSSANVERILKRKISGGFAPNSCKAINALGVKVNLIAALGYPNVHEVFQSLVDNETIDVISYNNPGETLGLEFNDGKIMITDFENILKINWDLIIERVGFEKILSKIEESDIMGFGHWSLIPEIDEMWAHFFYDIFPSVEDIEKKLFFVDLADIKKRSQEDIRTMLNLLQKINTKVPVMLSLNDQEAIDVSRALKDVKDINPNSQNFADYIEGGRLINEQVKLSYLVIHSPHFATITTEDSHYWVTEGYTSEPRFTTGAGDHFHSGVAAGLACELSPPEAILLGNALTAIFVRTGNSPNFNELGEFIERYLEYIEKDNPDFP